MKTFVAFLAFLLLVAVASAQTFASCPVDANADECGVGECLSLANARVGCACPSGSFGPECQSNSAPSCDASFATVTALETDNIPTQVTASFTNDELTVVVDSPLVSERRWTTVWVDESVQSHPSCGYPGDFWSRSTDDTDCHDIFTGVMDWSVQTSTCGWEFDNTDAEYFIYNADMILQHHDFIDPFGSRGGAEVERLTQHIIPLVVRFQKYVDVSTQISVSAPITLLAAITLQTVDPNTKEATIEITTNLLYPYKLDSESLSSLPGLPEYVDYTYEIVEDSDPALCPADDPNSSCTQKFRITIDASTGCEISGNYSVAWSAFCQAADNCFLDGPTDVGADLIILSEDFCAEISVLVEIDGSLTSYADNTYDANPAQSNFLLDAVSYYQALIVSPDATLESSTIRTVKTVNGGTTTILYDEGISGPAAAAFSLDGAGADYARFFFTLSEDWLGVFGQDEVRDYSVEARIDVTYSGVPGVKRLVLQGALDNTPVNLAAQIGLQADSLNEDSEPMVASASTSVLSFVAAAGALGFMMM
jgi:hypothetical protein